MSLYNGMAAILRALGNSITPLIFLILSSLMNIALDFLFVVYMDMGVRGAAIATVLSQTAAAIAVIYYAYRHVPFMRMSVQNSSSPPHSLKKWCALDCLLDYKDPLFLSEIWLFKV